MKLTLFKCIYALLFISLLHGCKKDEEQEKEIIRPVKLLKIEGQQSTIKGAFPGKVEASERADLAFQVPGRLIKLPIIESQEVKTGELIAALDPVEYQLALNETKSKYEFYKGQFERAQQLYDQKFVSKAKYESTKSEMDMAEANMQSAEKNLKDTTLEAPFSGIIAKKYVDNFQTVQAKEPIVLLHNLDKIDVIINIPENFAIHARKEERRKIQVELESAPNKLYAATLKEVSSSADPMTQTYAVKVTLPRPSNLQVLPGMTATVSVETYTSGENGPTSYTIPSSAVTSDEKGKNFVWVYNPQSSTVSKKEVSVSTMDEDKITVTKGIQPGLILVVAGVQFLREGLKVRPLESKGTEQ